MLASHPMDKARIEKTTVATPARDHHYPANAVLWIGLALMLAVLLLYGWTLDNGLQPGELEGGDLITHQYAQVQARPSNAPGYPLYTMGGWLWFHTIRALLHNVGISTPNPIPILSSYSTFWALLAMGLLYAILVQLTRSPQQPKGDGWLAGLICAFYAVTYFFWYYATTTEQYSSAIAQTLAIVYLYLRWQALQVSGFRFQVQGYVRDTGPAKADRLIVWLAFLCGLSLAHMVTVAFIVPPLVAVMLWQVPHLLRSMRLIILSILAALLPLLSYFYVYWRGAAHPEWWGSGDWPTAQAWFWAFISTAQGREELGWGLGPNCTFFANGFPRLIWQELSLPLVILGLIGIACLEKRQAVLLYGTCAIYLLFCWAYRCGNWFQVILPIYPLLLMGVAAAIHRLRQRERGGRMLYGVALIGLVMAIGWRCWVSLPAADSRNRPTDSAFDQAAVLLAQPLPISAALFATVHDALALQYLSAIWQVRPDVQIVNSTEAAQRLAAGEPVYSSWEAAPTLRAELPSELAPWQQPLDPYWVRFSTTALPLPLPLTTLNRSVIPSINLQGYSLIPAPPSPLATYRPALASATGGILLTLFWQVPTGVWPEGVSISVRPLQGNSPIADGQGSNLQQDRQQPAGSITEVAADQVLIDPYHFGLRSLLTPSANRIDGVQILLYRATAAGFENLAEFTLPVVP
jgi:Protein of unknown function (DUF2723)